MLSQLTKCKRTAAAAAVLVLAPLALASAASPAAAQPRFSTLSPAAIASAGYEERANLVIAAIRDSSYGPTATVVNGRTLDTPGQGTERATAARDRNVDRRTQRTQHASVRAQAIAEVVPLSTRGRDRVQALIESGRTVEELATAGKPDLDIVDSTVESLSSQATLDNVTGNTLVVVTSHIVEQYRSGVVSEGEDQTNVVFDAAGAIVTVEPVTLEDIDDATVELIDEYSDGSDSSEFGPTSDPDGVEMGHSGGMSAPSLRIVPSGITSTGRTAVVNYATTYWSTYNSAYRSFSPNDCTNFVSQAIERGGWTHVLGLWNQDTHWWYNFLNQTYSWAGAENWYRFAVNNSKRTTILSYVSSAIKGDMLQVKWAGATNMSHSMIVTDKIGTEIYLTYHSTNRLNKSFTWFNAQQSGETYFAHRT